MDWPVNPTDQDPEGWRAYKRQGQHRVDWLAARDGTDCHYCKTALDGDITIEHVVPKSLGGPWWPDNLVLTHYRCNHFRQNFNIEHPGCEFCRAARERYPIKPRRRPRVTPSRVTPPAGLTYPVWDNRGWRDDVYPGYRLVIYVPEAFLLPGGRYSSPESF